MISIFCNTVLRKVAALRLIVDMIPDDTLMTNEVDAGVFVRFHVHAGEVYLRS